MKSYFSDQIEALRLDLVFYAVVDSDSSSDIEYQKITVDEITTLDSALVFDRWEGTVPLFTINSAY